MDGMLSQDEINALLQGMDLSDTADSGASPETPQDSSSAENTDNAYVKDVAINFYRAVKNSFAALFYRLSERMKAKCPQTQTKQ